MTTSVIDNLTSDDGSSQDTNKSASAEVLKELVGEGKKFRTVEELALSKKTTDSFIEQLKRENNDLRKAVEQSEAAAKEQKTLSDILNALEKTAQGGDGSNNQNSAVSLEELTKLVRSVNSQEREQESRRTNKELVDKALIVKYGEPTKASEAIKNKARELNLRPQQIKDLSELSPEAFLQLFGVTNTKPVDQAAVKGNVNSAATNLVPDSGERTLSYYEAIRKKMGFKFFSDFDLQRQMQADMNRLGDKFNDLN